MGLFSKFASSQVTTVVQVDSWPLWLSRYSTKLGGTWKAPWVSFNAKPSIRTPTRIQQDRGQADKRERHSTAQKECKAEITSCKRLKHPCKLYTQKIANVELILIIVITHDVAVIPSLNKLMFKQISHGYNREIIKIVKSKWEDILAFPHKFRLGIGLRCHG